MKLSAPPPPPPPPPDQPVPGGQPAPDPNDPNNANANANANTPATPPTDAPAEAPTSVPVPAPEAKPLTWPSWYNGVDAALVGLVLLFAFASASFVARNSDLWLHLAAGKRLFAGQYTPGSDPFSYSGENRAWVNHSWLLDAFSYLLYGGQGKVLVIAKAVAIALTFGVLIAIRRPKFALWPWAVTACVAVLAAAPQFALRPLVASMLFLAVTLYLLFKMPHKPKSWRFPIAIGITFWLWSNCDAWFFIGPAALALMIVGDLIQSKLLSAPEGPATDDEPLGQIPDTLTMAKALGIGVLACMLNPHHIRVWELPFELVGAPGASTDPRFQQLLYSPTSGIYRENAGLGYNLNGLAYAILLVAGAAFIGFGYSRVRGAHLALWIGFAALSLLTITAVPFFALVAVPLVAAQLNSLSTRFDLKTWADSKSRIWLFGSSIGRVLCVLGACLLCVLAYPGWVHPDTANSAYARRFAWGVEPDPALVQAAEQLQQWHEKDKLPTDARGMITNLELANYVAWYAPSEKVYVNSRFNHHRPELKDFIAVRRGLGLFEVKDERPNLAETTEVFKKEKVEYVAIHSGPSDGPFLQGRAATSTSILYQSWIDWAPWYTDGRTTMFGWRPAGKPTFAALRIDATSLAFGPKVKRLPEPVLLAPPTQLGWEESFVRPARGAPSGAAEALGWLRYKQSIQPRVALRVPVRNALLNMMGLALLAAPESLPAIWLQMAVQAEARGAIRIPPNNPDAIEDGATGLAAPLLALRAAHRAIAEDPDHPDGYYALFLVLEDANLPLGEGERFLGRVTALRQCLMRMPSAETYKRGQYLGSATEVAIQLASMYAGQRIPPFNPSATKQQPAITYTGMLVDVFPLNELLGQSLVGDGRGKVERVARAQLLTGQPLPQNMRVLSGNTPLYLPLDAAHDVATRALAYAPIDLSGTPPDELKKQIQAIEAFRTDLETVLITATERYTTAKRAGQSLPVLVGTTYSIGLPEETLKLLTEREGDLSKEYKDQLPLVLLLRVSLELALGRIEEAMSDLKQLSTPEALAAFDKAGITSRFYALKLRASILMGDYRAAGDVLAVAEGKRVGGIEKLPPLGTGVPKPFILDVLARDYRTREPEKVLNLLIRPPVLMPFNPYLQTVLADTWTDGWRGVSDALRQQIASRMQEEADYYFRRGIYSLIEGDIATARERFEQSAIKPPPGWNLNTFHPPAAVRYLQLIDLAKKRTAP